MIGAITRAVSSNRALAVLAGVLGVCALCGFAYALWRRRDATAKAGEQKQKQKTVSARFSYSDAFFSSVTEKYGSDQFTMGLRRGGSWTAFPVWYSAERHQLRVRHADSVKYDVFGYRGHGPGPQPHVVVKALYFLRHGKGIHNSAEDHFGSAHWEAVEAKSDRYEDAPLNAIGLEQCRHMRRAVRGALALRDRSGQPVWQPQLIVTSPLTRAIETARLVFSDEPDDPAGAAPTGGAAAAAAAAADDDDYVVVDAKKIPGTAAAAAADADAAAAAAAAAKDHRSAAANAKTQSALDPAAAAAASALAVKPQSGLWAQVPVVSVEDVRETIGKNTCDRRARLSDLRLRYPNVSFDAAHFGADADPLWTPDHRETDAQIEARALRALQWLMTARAEEHIVVASHNGFISACLRVIGYPIDTPPANFTLRNCEMVPLLVAYAVTK